MEKAYPTEKEWERPKLNTDGGGSSKKRMVTCSNRIPKKAHHSAKHCVLCKKHGDAHNTHNTGECKKYNLDGTPKKGFAGKNSQQNSHNKNASRDQNASYLQLSVKIVKLAKSNKRLKHTKKKRKRKSVSESDDSDSS